MRHTKPSKLNKLKMLSGVREFPRCYEFIVMLRSNTISSDIKNDLSSLVSYISLKLDGKVLNSEYWGIRPLSYDIKGNRKAHFYYFGVFLKPSKVGALVDFAKNVRNVIRNIVLNVNKTEDQMSEKTDMLKNLSEDIEKEMGEIQWNQQMSFNFKHEE